MSGILLNNPRINAHTKKSGNLFNNTRMNVPILKKSGNLFYDSRINKSATTKKVWKHLMLLVSITVPIY